MCICLHLSVYMPVCVCLSVCVCLVHENRKLGADELPLHICLSWVERCGCSVRGLDRHQFILVENDASDIDVSNTTVYYLDANVT